MEQHRRRYGCVSTHAPEHLSQAYMTEESDDPENPDTFNVFTITYFLISKVVCGELKFSFVQN